MSPVSQDIFHPPRNGVFTVTKCFFSWDF